MGFFNLKKKRILIFGSNTQGRHGKGMALTALRKYGAVYGQARGLQGNSYAIVTKELQKHTRAINIRDIKEQVEELFEFAERKIHWEFILSPIGCGLAGFDPEDIAKLFSNAPENIIIPTIFKKLLAGEKLTLLICGDRLWLNKHAIHRELAKIDHIVDTVIHGNCRGADRIGGKIAQKEFNKEVIPFPANWAMEGLAAGPRRNARMLVEGKPDIVHAYHVDLEQSKGTRDMVEKALAKFLLVQVFRN